MYVFFMALRPPRSKGLATLFPYQTRVRSPWTELGCGMPVVFGAFPAGAPNPRPVQLSATASTDDLAARVGLVRGTVDVPAGIEAVLEQRFGAMGLPAVGVWAQVPHYVAGMPYPAAAARLIEGVNLVAGTDFSTDALTDDITGMRPRIDELVEPTPQHAAMLRQLEQVYDATREATGGDDSTFGAGELPSGDELAEELQRFLREQGG